MAPDVRHHDLYDRHASAGLEGMKQAILAYRETFPDARFIVEDQIAEGDKVLTRWRSVATHRGSLLGEEPTGKVVTCTGMVLERFERGKVIEAWLNWDALALLSAIGVVPAGSQVSVSQAVLSVRVVGIVNLTEDSFSDGGAYLDPDDAVEHALRLRRDGADLVELGPASSHPDARPVSPDEERQRVAPVMARLHDLGVPVAVDSFLPETQRFALAHGVAMLNDIQGFPHPEMYSALAAASCRLVMMHSVRRRGIATRLDTDPGVIWASIDEFFAGRLAALEAAGVDRRRLVLDPGLGFFLGTNPQCSLEVLAGIDRLRRRFGLPVQISASRKSFLQNLTGRGADKAGAATLAAELYAASQRVEYIRTHDVAALRDGLTVLTAIQHHAERQR